MKKQKSNPRVDAFFGKAKKWREEMEALREILLDCQLTEDLKWGLPCYAFQDGNVVVIQGFKAYCALMFFKGVLLKDPEGILVKTGENARVGRQIRFTDVQGIEKRKRTLKAYIRAAVDVEKAGLKVDLGKSSEPKIPEELQIKFDKSAVLKAAFDALTPGRRRAYIYYFTGAKQSTTRTARVEKCMPQILKGKGLNE